MKAILTALAVFAITISTFAEGPIKDITDAQFKDEIKEGIVLVDFWATWCMPCRAQGKILKSLAFDEREYLKVVKLDVDHNPKTSAKFYVQSIPTLIIFKDGKMVKRIVGLSTKEELKAELEKIRNE